MDDTACGLINDTEHGRIQALKRPKGGSFCGLPVLPYTAQSGKMNNLNAMALSGWPQSLLKSRIDARGGANGGSHMMETSEERWSALSMMPTHDRPKSAALMWPSADISRLSGLMSLHFTTS